MSQELAAALIRFFSAGRNIADLREALAKYTWNVPVSGSQEERDLVGELELALGEYEAGHISFDEFVGRIAPAINGLVVLGSPGSLIRTGAEAHLSRQKQWMAAGDIQPSLALSSVTLQTA